MHSCPHNEREQLGAALDRDFFYRRTSSSLTSLRPSIVLYSRRAASDLWVSLFSAGGVNAV